MDEILRGLNVIVKCLNIVLDLLLVLELVLEAFIVLL